MNDAELDKVYKAMRFIESAMKRNMEETKIMFEGKPASGSNIILNDAWNELNDLTKKAPPGIPNEA